MAKASVRHCPSIVHFGSKKLLSKTCKGRPVSPNRRAMVYGANRCTAMP
ncbi:MAG: hypothetical protein ICV79_05180 [Flavisolibacter sp.]|nr:hypothetical protein [Flavisolibacter sp.]